MRLNTLLYAMFVFLSARAFCQEDLIDDTKQAKPSQGVSAKEAAEVQQVGKLLDMFYADCGRYPTTQEGLGALISKPKTIDCKTWGLKTEKGPKPYMTSVPKDFGDRWKYSSKNGFSYSLKP